MVTPSDALVLDNREFERIIRLGFDFLSHNTNALMTIGIKPSRPETGYGYIQVPKNGTQEAVRKVDMFKEKPNYETAVKFVEEGNYFWNSGIFIWTLDGIMNAIETYLPDIKKVFDKGIYNFGTPEEQDFINDHFTDCPNISIDYGVMEKSPNTYTIPADFGWSDIGTWGSLYTHVSKDEQGNAVRGKVVTVDNHNCVINIEEGTEAVVQGLDDYLVAYRDKSLLVCRLHDEQQIKVWIEGLK